MNKQSLLDSAFTYALTMEDLCNYNGARYRLGDRRCLMGFFIDEIYSPGMEGGSITDLFTIPEFRSSLYRIFDVDNIGDIKFLQSVQNLHDCAFSVSEMLDNFAVFAARMELKLRFCDYEIHYDFNAPHSQRFQYTHKDYDGPGDTRIGNCASVSEAISEIKERLNDN